MQYRGLTISITPDCGVNDGGFYCQVYSDSDMTNEVGDFCIHKSEIEENPDIIYWVKLNVDANYHYYKEDL